MSELQWAGLLWSLIVLVVTGFALLNRRRRTEPISRNLPVIGVALVAALFVMAVQAARLQVFQQRVFARKTGIDPSNGEVLANPRLNLGDVNRMRGSISTSDGTVLAWSEQVGDVYQRRYTDARLSHVAGYFSPLLYGLEGIERTANVELTAGRDREIGDQLAKLLRLEDPEPENIRLSIRSDVQALAQASLAGHVGAAVVMDVRSGAVLALASEPYIDPAPLAVTSDAELDLARQYWVSLNDDPSRPFVRRPTLGLYTPGSTFKVVTAAAAVDTGMATPQTVYEDDGTFTVDGHTLIEVNRPDETVTQWTLEDGIAYSLNIVLAQVGLELGKDRLSRYAGRFGIDAEIPFDLPVASGQVASSDDFLDSPAALADTAFGQGELLVTPLNMAMIAAAIANDGVMMRPHMIAEYRDQQGSILEQREPEVWRRAIESTTAWDVSTMMVAGVERGYSGGALVPGLVVGGKTGTAETGDGNPHGWFIGFGGLDSPQYAVSVVLEHGGSGGGIPSAIAGSLLQMAVSG